MAHPCIATYASYPPRALVSMFIVKFLYDERKYRKRRVVLSADISAHLFIVTCNKVCSILIYKNWIVDVKGLTQHILLSHLCPPGRFLLQPVSFSLPAEFTPNPKSLRKMIIVANTSIFIGRKNLSPWICTPKKRKLPPRKMSQFVWIFIC